RDDPERREERLHAPRGRLEALATFGRAALYGHGFILAPALHVSCNRLEAVVLDEGPELDRIERRRVLEPVPVGALEHLEGLVGVARREGARQVDLEARVVRGRLERRLEEGPGLVGLLREERLAALLLEERDRVGHAALLGVDLDRDRERDRERERDEDEEDD